MSADLLYRWADGALHPLDDAALAGGRADGPPAVVEAADSWLVSDGAVLALDLHRNRFLTSIPRHRYTQVDPQSFWNAAIALLPRAGDWFPRVELRATDGRPQLLLRVRPAPERTRSVVLAEWTGPDPRTAPSVKGPDLERMSQIRRDMRTIGAGEAVIRSADGFVVETTQSALLWWRGEILCGPLDEQERVDSVTARSVLTLAAALGFDCLQEAVTPAELDGTELWALNALHGPRIVTAWRGGPGLAEKPGRLGAWRSRLEALRRPL